MINKNIIIIILLLIMGFIFLYIDQYKRLSAKMNEQKIVYRYIPRIPADEMNDNIFPSDVFETMFSQPTPWLVSINDLDARKNEELNRYFVSQI
jgi:hypothetical protein